MRRSEAPPSPPPAAAPIAPAAMVNSLEDDVFGDLFDAIATLYEQRGVRISRRDLAALASEKANEIAASQADPALRRAMIPLIITQLDKELRAGKGKTDTGKRSA